MSRIRFN